MFERIENIQNLDHFSSTPAFLVDSDILIDISKMGFSQDLEKKLLASNAILIFPSISIIELGFGPYDLVDSEEMNFFKKMRMNVFANEFDLFAEQYSIDIKTGKRNKYVGKWVNISPDSNNWHHTKESLMFYMNDTGTKVENARKLQFDVVMGAMAWNTRSFIWTNNIKDHLLASFYRGKTICNRTNNKWNKELLVCHSSFFTPIFNTDLLNRLLLGESLNIYSELKKYTKHTQIHEILSYLEVQ
jgi:predicted nucleic acid-binding protein